MRQGFYIFLGMLALSLAGGCGNKRIDNTAMEKEFENAPEWVLVGHDPDRFSAVGAAPIGKAGIQFAKTAAMAHARNELASQLAVKVHALVNTLTRQTNTGDSQMVDQVGKQVSRQVAEETLSGTRQADVWISPSSDLYVLVVMDEEAVKASVRTKMAASFRDDASRWKDFQDRQAELDQEIDRLF